MLLIGSHSPLDRHTDPVPRLGCLVALSMALASNRDDRVAVAEARVRVPANGSITIRLIVR
ncbi:MAG: hypothetical protein H0U58_10295 [Chloroflexi bacterium]|nr:hypothetical protein [Chloroflexota bacterium]